MSIAPTETFDAEQELERLEPAEREAARAFLQAHPPGQGAPLAIVIPAYNEEPTVAEVIREIPGETAGLQQINIQIPANAPAGAGVPIVLTVDSVNTQP